MYSPFIFTHIHLIICLTTLYTSFITPNNDLIVVALMIKNEAPVIEQTLKPLIESGISNFLIFDTGSTDNTIEIAKNYLNTHKYIHNIIIQEPFIDFATSRNRALDLAEELFPHASFILMPDAEWYLCNGKELINFCMQHQYDNYDSYSIKIVGVNIEFSTTRLIKYKSKARFKGEIHEYLQAINIGKIPSNIYFKWEPTNYGNEKSKIRWENDKNILLKKYNESPNDTRTIFYLAQTYNCLGDLENALKFYTIRSTMDGWIQETFISWYHCGLILENLDQKLWPQALEAYLQAYNLLPQRIEPLLKITEHYLQEKNYAIAYLFAQRSLKIPYPTDSEQLFIDKSAYTYSRYNLLSIICWYVGEYTIGEYATRQALKIHDLPHLHHNLSLYLQASKK